jgi:hypothetical protein
MSRQISYSEYSKNNEDSEDSEDSEDLEELMNLNWLRELRKEEENYDEFYNSDVNEINVYFLFTSNNTLTRVRKRNYILNEINELTSEEIIKIIKSEKSSENKVNKLDMLLKYNLDISPGELIQCMGNEELYQEYAKQSFVQIKAIRNIKYNPTIELLKDLNCLYVIYKEIEVEQNEGQSINTKTNKSNTSNNTAKKTVKNTSKKIVFNSDYTRKNRNINFVT